MLQIPLILQNEVIGILNLTAHLKLVDIQNEDILVFDAICRSDCGSNFLMHI